MTPGTDGAGLYSQDRHAGFIDSPVISKSVDYLRRPLSAERHEGMTELLLTAGLGKVAECEGPS